MVDPEGLRVGTVWFDTRQRGGNGLLSVENELWFQLVTGDLQSGLCLLLPGGESPRFALENKPWVTIAMEQRGC